MRSYYNLNSLGYEIQGGVELVDKGVSGGEVWKKKLKSFSQGWHEIGIKNGSQMFYNSLDDNQLLSSIIDLGRT